METEEITRLEITLPASLRAFAEEQSVSGGYATVTEYVEELLQRELRRQSQERLEALLLEGLESGPATEMTDSDWDAMRRRFDERHGSAESP